MEIAFAVYIILGALFVAGSVYAALRSPYKDAFLYDVVGEVKSAGLLVSTLLILILILIWPALLIYILSDQ